MKEYSGGGHAADSEHKTDKTYNKLIHFTDQ